MTDADVRLEHLVRGAYIPSSFPLEPLADEGATDEVGREHRLQGDIYLKFHRHDDFSYFIDFAGTYLASTDRTPSVRHRPMNAALCPCIAQMSFPAKNGMSSILSVPG